MFDIVGDAKKRQLNLKKIYQNRKKKMIHQNPERSQRYFYLIEQLLRSPQSQHESILDDNSELLDSGLIEIIRQREEAEKNIGNIQNAELLNSIADRVNKTVPSSSNDLENEEKANIESSSSDNFSQPTPQQKVPQPVPKLPESQQKALLEIFNKIIEHGANSQILYPIFQKYLLLFNLEFADNLRHWATATLSQESIPSPHNLARCLAIFSDLMLYLPLGNREANIAIVRAGYESALTFLTREKFPEVYAELMINLGIAIEEDPLADSVEKWEEAIACYQKASEIFTREVNPEKWASIQDNLGNAYRNREEDDTESNLQQSITFYQNALEVFNPKKYPQQWGVAQYNLGNSYLQLSDLYLKESRENNEQLLETAINCYEKALQTLTKDTYPDNWALTQMTLGKAYSVRLQGNPNDNHKKAQQHLENALSIYTLETNPDLYRQVKAYQRELQEFRVILSQTDSSKKNQEELSLSEMTQPGINELRQGDYWRQKYENRLGDELVNLNEAIKFFEQGLGVFSYENAHNKELWAAYQNQLGNCYSDRVLIQGNSNDIEKAINAYELALRVFPKNTLNWAVVQKNLGNTYLDRQEEPLENLNQAIDYYQKSLIVYKQGSYPTEWAMVQMGLGVAYRRRATLGHSGSAEDIEQAIEYYKKALEVYQDPSKDPENWAELQQNLGVVYSDRPQGNYAENLELAIDYLNQSLKVRTLVAYPYRWAKIQMTLGAIYMQRKQGGRGDQETNLRLGIECLEKALQVFNPEKYLVDWMQTQHNLITCYKHLGGLTQDRKDYKKAIAYGTKIISKCQDHPQILASTQFELGTCYKNLGVFIGENKEENLARATQCYRDALRVFSRETQPFNWADIKNSLGNAYQHNGQYQEAINSYQEALLVHTRDDFPIDYIKTVINIGNTRAKYKKLTDAFNSYQEAINVFEDLLYRLRTDDDAKRKLGEEWVRIYQLMVSTCLKLGKEKPEYYATAWEYVERSKTRRLVEIFAQTKPADVSDTDWQEFQDLRNQITNTEKWIEDKEELIILLEESEEKLKLDKRKIDLINLKQQLNKKWETNPQLAIKQKAQYTPFSKLGEKLSDDYTVIIQWYILQADKKFCAFIYNRQSFEPYVWESSSEDLENLQQWYEEYFFTYNQFIETRKSDSFIDELPERLNRLAEILHIDDLLNYLPPNCQQVILIPHLFLHLFPIHALPIKLETWQKFNPNSVNTNQINYLFECFEKGVRYAPSCQTLLMLEKRKCPNFDRLLAIGNPTEDSDLAELCVNTVDKFWKQQKPQSQPEVLCGAQATKDALINQLQDYLQNVHTFLYSGHGTFESGSPLDSGLILHKDNRLELTEIFNLNLQNCRLVTLIACEAAMTDAGSITDEYIGLPSAFLRAGVSGIISALWEVEQTASVFLGIKLYQNLLNQNQEKKDVIKALNEAQLWLRTVDKKQLLKWIKDCGLNVNITDWLKKQNQQPFSNPYYWAAFCVIGK